MRTPLTLILAAMLVLVCTGCNPIKSTSAAESAVADFHKKLDAGDFKSIYDAADPQFKKAAKEQEFISVLEAVHRKLGNVKSSDRQTWNINSYNLQTTVNLSYKTSFAEGDGIETFRYHIDGDKALLLYYNINSTTLITK